MISQALIGVIIGIFKKYWYVFVAMFVVYSFSILHAIHYIPPH